MTHKMPQVAWFLGYAGLIPFLGLMFSVVFDTPLPLATDLSSADWLLVYAAVIISFLGAVHWGVALGMRETLNDERCGWLMTYSILPSLLAWIALLLPDQVALFAVSVLIVLAYFADRWWLFPLIRSDYSRLRLHLTLAVATLLFIAGMYA